MPYARGEYGRGGVTEPMRAINNHSGAWTWCVQKGFGRMPAGSSLHQSSSTLHFDSGLPYLGASRSPTDQAGWLLSGITVREVICTGLA